MYVLRYYRGFLHIWTNHSPNQSLSLRFGKHLVPADHVVQMEALLKKTLDFFAAAWRKLRFG